MRTQQVLQYIRANGSMTRQDAEELLNIKTATALRLIGKLLHEEKIKTTGTGKNTKYILADKNIF